VNGIIAEKILSASIIEAYFYYSAGSIGIGKGKIG